MSTAHISCPARRRPVHGLDVVRLIAAMLVVIYHLGFKAWALPGSSLRHVIDAPVTHPPGYGLTWCGWIGVQVFFVVSGAVIAYSAEGARPGSFARRRLARLLPAILIATPLALPLAVLLFRTPPAAALMLGLKTVAFAPVGPWIMGQFWTISIELAFYAAVCAILASGMPERGCGPCHGGLGLRAPDTGLARLSAGCSPAGGWPNCCL
ncbi:acyltransferase family protein [Novosphingobium panipatense]|uniref:acyltransferase family protein n=1 Tax=Novosphingobium panipatense TaxID=428991 RepID=UPI0036124C8D